jgi:hypothetical protein
MNNRRVLGGFAAAAALAVSAFAAPAATAATPAASGTAAPHAMGVVKPATWVQPTTYATAGTPTNTAYCVSISGTDACFQPYGDLIWVRDTASDGHPAYADWENDLWSGSQWIAAYASTCESTLGAGKWGYCDEEFFENDQPNNVGGTGSRVDIWARTYNSISAPRLVTNNG